jgi:hypothetical protein
MSRNAKLKPLSPSKLSALVISAQPIHRETLRSSLKSGFKADDSFGPNAKKESMQFHYQSVPATVGFDPYDKKAEFEKQVTNTAQEAAGVPKTVVTPQALVARVEEVITDVTTTNALISATALVQETVANAATTAFTTTATWIAESAFGVYVQEAFGKVEVAVIGLFSDAKAKVAADKLQARLQKLKAGATS